MPVRSFVPAVVHDWTDPPAAPPRGPARAAPARKKRAPRKKLPPQCRTVLIGRLEAAVERGAIDLHDDFADCDQLCITGGEYALLLRILFPEEYVAPHEGRPLPEPTATAPGSAERIAEYAFRAVQNRVIQVLGDATAHGAHDRGLKIAQRKNGSGVKVVGWADE